MKSFDKKPAREARPLPPWRASDGRLREKRPGQIQSGYKSGETQRREGLTPKPVAEMENSYGGVSAGVSRDRRLLLVVSRRRAKYGPQRMEDERLLQSDREGQARLTRGEFLTEGQDAFDGALGYREELKKPPYFLMRRLKRVAEQGKFAALEETLPFLNAAKEQQELESLSGRRDAPAQTERETLRAGIAEKQREERRFLKHLERTMEKAKRTPFILGPLFRPPEDLDAEGAPADDPEDADGGENPGDEQGPPDEEGEAE